MGGREVWAVHVGEGSCDWVWGEVGAVMGGMRCGAVDVRGREDGDEEGRGWRARVCGLRVQYIRCLPSGACLEFIQQ